MLITAYNRADQIERCVASVTNQNFEDFEIVVVDDASTDDTLAVLAGIDEPRLRVVEHERNRGISPARRTTVEHARGEWLVVLDSDWELLPHSLTRLRELIGTLAPGVRIIRSRLEWDGGSVSPPVIPEGVADYHARLAWLDRLAIAGGASDAGHCIHRDAFTTGSYFHDGRGQFESLWETNLARREPSLWVDDVLGLEHVDAANSSTREADASRAIPRMLAEARDFRWQVEAMLSVHGDALAREAPHYRRDLLERAALETFLTGDRRGGIRHTRDAVRAGATGVGVLGTLVFGVLGPRVLARVKLQGRRVKARRRGGA